MNAMPWIRRSSASLVLVAVAGTALATPPLRPAAIDATSAAAYCTSTGGRVQDRQAAYGTNNPVSSWLFLATHEQFCQYVAPDQSTINLSLETLYTERPTLAALAYYAAVQWNGEGNGNPASYYCTQLGGAEIGATAAAGGAWVAKVHYDPELEACVFPDNSVIDSWGLLYHSVGTVRGIDLATVLRYPNPYAAN
jgi:putative hemolysin